MITSMSYSRYFSTAIATAVGMPIGGETAATAKRATLATADLSQLHAINDPSAIPWQTIAMAAMNAIHLICWRSSRSPER